MFRFLSPRLLWRWVGRSVGQKKRKKKKMNTWRGLGSREGRTAKEKTTYIISLWKKIVSLLIIVYAEFYCLVKCCNKLSIYLIKEKDITSHQLLLIKQDRVLVN